MKDQRSKIKDQKGDFDLKKRVVIELIGSPRKHLDIKVKEKEDVTVLLLGLDESGDKDVKVTIAGKGAKVQILGIIVGKDGKSTINTLQHHTKPDTVSDLLIKSVMFGQAKLDYDGLIKIDNEAQRSNAYQRNENLLLSDQAYVESKPELEILANDVRCTHGVTVGKIDEEILFYLTSRGIEKHIAERLVVEGFFEPVLSRIPDDSISNKLRRDLKALLYDQEKSKIKE